MAITNYIHTQWTGSAEPPHDPDSQLNAGRVSSHVAASTDLNSLNLQTLKLVNLTHFLISILSFLLILFFTVCFHVCKALLITG